MLPKWIEIGWKEVENSSLKRAEPNQGLIFMEKIMVVELVKNITILFFKKDKYGLNRRQVLAQHFTSP